MSLPFLPGYDIDVTPHSKKVYHKTQSFNMSNGIRVDKSASVSVRGNAHTSNLRLATTQDLTQQQNQNEQKQDLSNTSSLPAWVAFDRKVLRFYTYFKELVHSSAAENWRLRKCVIYFYLEDNSLHIAEPRVENSGLPQGTLLSRHLPTKNDGTVVGVHDLFIGADLELYGRTYHCVDADQFTRDYYQQALNVTVGEAEEYPIDAFTQKQTSKPLHFNKVMNPLKEFMEASLGKPRGLGIEATQQFLKNDGKVLRFYCVWDDNKMYGEKRPYILHYFLADDTVEVLEVHQANSGRDGFPQLLRRSRLPKQYLLSTPTVSSIGHRLTEDVEYYGVKDLTIGANVGIFGRNFTICGCDGFTKAHYIKNFGMQESDFPEINMEDSQEVIPRMDPPKYNGFGSEEDSLGSFLYLMPKVPKKDFKKLMDFDGVSLRFLSKFANPNNEDRNRQFVITYYMADDTVSVFEKFQRNSGFVGGKFLERKRLKNPDSGVYFKGEDFFVGATLNINTFIFNLEETDIYTREFMEKNAEMFPGNK